MSAGRRHPHMRPYPVWLELAGLAVLLAAIVVPLVLFGRPTQTRAVSPPGSPSPRPTPRLVFQFASPDLHISVLGSVKGFAASNAIAGSVQSALGTFYDQSFLDPQTWTRGVPAAAWNVFSPSLRPQAEQDSTSLALGTQVPTLARLSVIDASLSIRVLVNPRGGVEIAAADVRFIARGDLKDGRSVSLTNRASFLFQSVGGRWLIVGYPSASTDLKLEASPTPTAFGTSPSPTASRPMP